MNCECRRCRACAINVQKRYLLRRTRKLARAVLAASCADQACLREFRERFPDEGGVRIHTFSEGCRRDFLFGVMETKRRHDVAATVNWTLVADISPPPAFVMFNSTIWIQF